MRKDRLFKRKSRRSFTLCISKELCWVVLRAELSITEKCWPVSHWSRSSPCLNEWSLHPQVPEPSCLLSVPSSQDVLRSPAWWRGYGWDRRNRVLDYHCCFPYVCCHLQPVSPVLSERPACGCGCPQKGSGAGTEPGLPAGWWSCSFWEKERGSHFAARSYIPLQGSPGRGNLQV